MKRSEKAKAGPKFRTGKLARIVNLVGHVARLTRHTVEVSVLTAESGYQNVICYRDGEVMPVPVSCESVQRQRKGEG